MKSSRPLALLTGLILPSMIPPTLAQEASSSPPSALSALVPAALPEPGTSVSVGRRPELEAVRISHDFWICGLGRITTPLPIGYPPPTAAGAIEIKSYPSVRRAEVSGAGRADLASNFGFWKLFNHIKSRDIAMTAPVEMDYHGLNAHGAESLSGWSMAFLYREPGLGPTGRAGDVQVQDSIPTTYLSVGALGNYGIKDALRVLGTLKQCLTELASIEATGDVRVLHYNGPEVPAGRRWFEVQIPIRSRRTN